MRDFERTSTLMRVNTTRWQQQDVWLSVYIEDARSTGFVSTQGKVTSSSLRVGNNHLKSTHVMVRHRSVQANPHDALYAAILLRLRKETT